MAVTWLVKYIDPIGNGVIHNSLNIDGRFVHKGIDYGNGFGPAIRKDDGATPGEWIHGPTRQMSEEALEAERVFEEITESEEDVSLFDETSAPPATTGTSGNDSFGTEVLRLSLSTSGTGSAMFDGGAGDDTIMGNDGSDTLLGGAGADTIIGGSFSVQRAIRNTGSGDQQTGFALVDANDDGFIDASEASILPISFDLPEALIDDYDTNFDELWDAAEYATVVVAEALPFPYNDAGAASIEFELLSDSGDELRGGAGEDSIYGGLGDDTIHGDADDDRLFGEEDNDIIKGGDGNDQVDGGQGDDLINGDGGDDELSGGEGLDTLLGGAGADTIGGGAGEDDLSGGDGADELSGGAGADVISGGTSSDTLFGGEGNDLLLGDGDSDSLYGEQGEDLLTGGLGDDFLAGGAENDIYVYSAGDGNDVISDTSSVQAGLADRIQFTDINSTDVVFSRVNGNLEIKLPDGSLLTVLTHHSIEHFDFADGVTINYSSLDLDIVTRGTEGDDDLVGSDFDFGTEILEGLGGNDTLDGNGGDNRLFGGAGNDILSSDDGDDSLDGGDGEDTLFGSTGDDTYEGGDGVDTLDLSYAASGFTLDLANGTLVFADGFTETVSNIENAIGGDGANELVGTTDSNLLDGGAGNDTITGGGGGDVFRFETGDGLDIVSDFEIGVDQIEINGEFLDPTTTPVGVSISQQGPDVLITYAGGDTIALSNVSLSSWLAAYGPLVSGTSGDDTVTGSGDGEYILPGSGNDTIYGYAGDDTIAYVSGDDKIVGSKKNYGQDTLDLSQYSSDQVGFEVVEYDVFITTPDGMIELDYQARFDIGHIRTNIESIVFSDQILDEAAIRSRAVNDQSTAGDDSINGSYLDDVIVDGAGNDTIDAWYGDDTIIYSSGNDIIKDGNYGQDILDLSQYSSDQVSFRNDVHDIFINTPDGTIELDYQSRHDVGHSESNIETIIFSDVTLTDAVIRQRAVDDPNTSGDDVISGTRYADSMTTSAGNDTLDAWLGDDTITYVSGNDQIIGGVGQDTLDLSQYSSDQVSFRNDGHDVFIATPDGEIELHYQVRQAIGHSQTNIEALIFSDGTLDDASIRQRALDDQNTVGDDVVSGTINYDLISGGVGNDTLEGNGGADVFSFVPGDGNDVIIDFADGLDLISFTGGPTSFADLIITDVNGDAVIDYGAGESITLTNVTSSLLTQDDFQFV
ncbi:calcium-binding protein [Roseovarius sp. CAU 1744]|uniref:calcium-binding protein n=1 Tax=Roseovarius sp. CAU 1744 TaxID=3140368 RepID=UPI00325ACFD2